VALPFEIVYVLALIQVGARQEMSDIDWLPGDWPGQTPVEKSNVPVNHYLPEPQPSTPSDNEPTQAPDSD
jgi:hypothetical protein